MILLATILLSAHFYTVSPGPVVNEQIGCAEGEPLLGLGMFIVY